MTRFILAQYDLLTPFDLRDQIFMIDLEFFTDYHGKNFELKKYFWTFFQKNNIALF